MNEIDEYELKGHLEDIAETIRHKNNQVEHLLDKLDDEDIETILNNKDEFGISKEYPVDRELAQFLEQEAKERKLDEIF